MWSNHLVCHSPLVFRNESGKHAEELMIEGLQNLKDVSITVFINYSPCFDCCALLKQFISTNNIGCLQFIAAAPYFVERITSRYKRPDLAARYHDKRKGLKSLFAGNARARLKAFEGEDWLTLAQLVLSSPLCSGKSVDLLAPSLWYGHPCAENSRKRSRATEDRKAATDLQYLLKWLQYK